MPGVAAAEVFRIRRKSDGRWYGRSSRFGKSDSCWHRDAGKYLTRPALVATIQGSEDFFQDCEVIAYRLEEVETPLSINSFRKGWRV